MMFRENRCIQCRACLEACQQGVISWNGNGIIIAREKCLCCGLCAEICFAEARETVGREMTILQVMAEIERDLSFYDESGGGVTFSGGEPLSQPDFLQALLKSCQERDIHTALDTSGFASWETLNRIRNYVDLFLYDLKLMDAAKHQKFTGLSNQLILKNLQALSERGHNIILRVAIIPGLTDDDDNIRRIGQFAAALPCLNRVSILPYHQTAIDKYNRLNKVCAVSEIRPPSEEQMAGIAELFGEFGLPVKIGG